MSRTGRIYKRIAKPDEVYHSPLVGKFINHLMQRGKNYRRKIFYSSLALLSSDKTESFEFLKALIMLCRELKSGQNVLGGATYQVSHPKCVATVQKRWP